MTDPNTNRAIFRALDRAKWIDFSKERLCSLYRDHIPYELKIYMQGNRVKEGKRDAVALMLYGYDSYKLEQTWQIPECQIVIEAGSTDVSKCGNAQGGEYVTWSTGCCGGEEKRGPLCCSCAAFHYRHRKIGGPKFKTEICPGKPPNRIFM